MRIVDLSKEVSIDQINSEVCIVGSGPDGGIVASGLIKKGVNITLLEQGGYVSR